jgi:hypothetical protein
MAKKNKQLLGLTNTAAQPRKVKPKATVRPDPIVKTSRLMTSEDLLRMYEYIGRSEKRPEEDDEEA